MNETESPAPGDRRDQWTPMIEASHPMKTGAHDAYATALEMVGNRHSKGALVQLVCWLVQRVDMAENDLRNLRRNMRPMDPEAQRAHGVKGLGDAQQ